MKSIKYILIAAVCALFSSCMDGDWEEPYLSPYLYGNRNITENNVITACNSTKYSTCIIACKNSAFPHWIIVY